MRDPTDARAGRESWDALEIALYYLNLRTSEKTWRGDLAKPFESAARELSRGDNKLYGIASAAKFQEILATFQGFATRMLSVDPTLGPGSASARVLMLKELHSATGLTVDGFVLEPQTGRLDVVWGTDRRTGTQMLFGFLALGLLGAPFWPLAKCEGCGQFFAKSSHRVIKYCSSSCRKRLEIARYRARQRDGIAHKRPQRRPRRPLRSTSKGIGDVTTS